MFVLFNSNTHFLKVTDHLIALPCAFSARSCPGSDPVPFSRVSQGAQRLAFLPQARRWGHRGAAADVFECHGPGRAADCLPLAPELQRVGRLRDVRRAWRLSQGSALLLYFPRFKT